MKTKVMSLLFTVMFLLVGNVSAGDFVTFGVIKSVNLANVNISMHKEFQNDVEAPDTKFKPAYSTGFYFNFNINEIYSFQPEIKFNSKGYIWKVDSLDFKSTTTLNYIEIPLLSVFKIYKGFNLLVGPYMEIHLNGKQYESNIDESNNKVFPWDETSPYSAKGLGLGIIAGGEFNVDRFSIGARYSLGVNDIANAEKMDIKHNILQFMLGIELF